MTPDEPRAVSLGATPVPPLADRVAPSLSVVIMAYNEAANLPVVIDEIEATLLPLERRHEILIVDDGSSDDTGAIAEQLTTVFPSVRAIHHPTNQGLGGVYRTGFTSARCDLITFFPADGQFSPSIIARFLTLMDSSDMVLGQLPARERSLVGRTLSASERLLYRVLFGRFPRFQGVLMFRRSMLDEIELHSTGRGWGVLMELIVRASRQGYRIVTEPTEVRPRLSGKSKVNNVRTVLSNVRQVSELRRYL